MSRPRDGVGFHLLQLQTDSSHHSHGPRASHGSRLWRRRLHSKQAPPTDLGLRLNWNDLSDMFRAIYSCLNLSEVVACSQTMTTACSGFCGEGQCTCVRCPNFLICHSTGPVDYFQCHGGLCVQCAMMLGYMRFRAAQDECCVCYDDNNTQAKFRKCQHWCCVECMRRIMFGPEEYYHLDPSRFGCPPCPNGCTNPERGLQCGCDEYETVQETWKNERPQEYARFNLEENESVDREEGNPQAGRCPMCRSVG